MRRTSYLALIIALFAVAVRFGLINQPFVDHWSWRQSDVAAIARNYYEGGFHFARPQIDWAGDQPGYVGTEFPLLPFLAALSYQVFGVHEWIGRVQGVILFALSLPFFFLLVRKAFGEISAVWALFFYSFAPLGIMTSRCFMPDMPSLALSIIGLYFFQEWLADEESTSAFVISAVCVSLSILIKATSAIIAAPLFCLAFQRFRFSSFQRFEIWLFAAIALLPSAIWYWHAYQISLQFYPHHFFGAGGVKIMSLLWYWQIVTRISFSLTVLLLVAGILGAWWTRYTPAARPFQWWLASMVLFFIVVGYGNRHPWYALPLVPIFAAFTGAAFDFVFSKIRKQGEKIAVAVCLIAVFLIASFVKARSLCEPSEEPMRAAGLVLKSSAPPNALVVAADSGFPTIFYYAERKGWHLMEHGGLYYGEPRDSAEAIADLEELRKRGASFLVFTSETSWWLDYYKELGEFVGSNSTPIASTPEFKIFKFSPVSK